MLGMLLVQCVLTLNLQIFPKREYCFGVIGGEEYQIEYVVSGINERNTIMRARDSQKRILFINEGNDYSRA